MPTPRLPLVVTLVTAATAAVATLAWYRRRKRQQHEQTFAHLESTLARMDQARATLLTQAGRPPLS